MTISPLPPFSGSASTANKAFVDVRQGPNEIRRNLRPIRSYPKQCSRRKELRREAFLARVQLDDELFVHDRLHFFPGRDARNFAVEAVAVDCEPIGNRDNLREIKIAQH